MKGLALLPVLLLCSAPVLVAEEIPVRSPEVGESRPGWWFSCWAEHIVVIEGTISVEDDDKPDVTITVDPKVAGQFFDKKTQDLQETYSDFNLATLKPKRLLFASPGITLLNLDLAATARGNAAPLTFLVPLLKMDDGKHVAVKGGRDKQEGVFIFNYGTHLAGVHMVLDWAIPPDGLRSAEMVFEHRTRLDHLNHPYRKEEKDDK